MPKLWTFGCSHVESSFNTDSVDERWPNILAEHWNMDLVNLGQIGGSNDLILERLLDNYDKIDSDDRIIVLLTYFNRVKILKEDLLPSDKRHENLYKILLERPGYFTNTAIKNVLALGALLEEKDHMIFAVDPKVISALRDKGISTPKIYSWPQRK